MRSLMVPIVNYKTPQLVLECIASLKRFAPSAASMDIVVVDNASGDDSLGLLAGGAPEVRRQQSGVCRWQ